MPDPQFDLVVLGGGPAGVNAALSAASAGLCVALVDENPAAGGQVYRAPTASFIDITPTSVDAAQGDQLRARLAASPVQTFFLHQIWSITTGYRIDAIGPSGPVHWHSRAIVAASGTTERVVPFDGWTELGVIGLAAATILLKSQKMLPGRSTLVAGCGPLLAAVAANTLKGGGQVAAIVDLAGTADWARTLPAMLSRPDLLRQGFAWWRAIRRASVPMYSRHAIERVVRKNGMLHATIAPVDAEGAAVAGPRRTLLVDCVTVGHGLSPATDVTRLLRAVHRYDRLAGGWVAVADAEGRTSRPGLYIAGDAAGIAGAAAAAHHGALAGLACARDLGRLDAATFAERAAPLRRAWQHAARFGHAMASLMALRDAQVGHIPDDAIVCRCEDVTRAEIDTACAAGATDMNQLKAWTRCGMGPCQGRTCGDVTGALLARHVGTREAAGCFSGRTPLRPVSVEALTGEYTYDDIPIPKAAPL